jgi:pimeloyl-ACP methyl ester carboxylesterase
MISMDIVRAALLAVVPTLALVGHLPLWWIYVVLFVNSTLGVGFNAAGYAAIASLAKEKGLMRANGFIQTSSWGALVVGPLLATFLLTRISLQGVLWVDAATFLVSVSGYLIGSQAAGQMPLPPSAELQWWYQYYFATERGRAGYDKYRRDFAKLIWQLASPCWDFDEATFARSAAAFDNPDHVSIVIHNYRWRLGLAEGEPRYDELEQRLAAAPNISVPTITLEGDANGAPHPEASAYAGKFMGRYEHRFITGGVGHNLPQEAPQAFARAIIDIDNF